MDVAKVAKDYFVSSQSTLLIPNREYGSRKLVHIGITRSSSVGTIKLDSGQRVGDLSDPGTPNGRTSGLKGLGVLVGSAAGYGRSIANRQRIQSVKEGNKWLHPSDALLKGHILYSVKFLGECAVDQPKGKEVVKSAITKMKFNKHIKRAEGQKPPKVELIISADAVKILEPKSRTILHQYPLHRISYCADDKSDKRMLTFIGKAANSKDHFCYVFDSEKCAEEITLTVGQAFDLAYKRFLETSTLDNDVRQQLLNFQKQVHSLQFENEGLKKRISELEKLKDRSDLEEYMRNNQIQDLSIVKLNLQESSTEDDNSSVPSPESQKPNSVVGRRLENLILSDDNTSSPRHQTNGSQQPMTFSSPSHTSVPPVLSPPPPHTRPHRANSHGRLNSQNLPNSPNYAQTSPKQIDPFGMQAFNPSQNPAQELIDIQAGFSQGLTFGTDDFSVEDFDPLNQRL